MNAQISPDELKTVPLNVQNMPLLRAATNSNPLIKDDISPTLVDNQAILHENRPNLTGNASSSPEEMFSSETSDQISIYVVHDGDTLQGIAKMYNVSVNTIQWANNIDSKHPIRKDQQLIILPISGVKYVVKKGDTLQSIAKALNGDVDEIVAFNGLEGNKLKVGDEIIVPNGEQSSGPSSSGGSSTKTTTPTTIKNLASKATSNGYFIRPVIGGIKTQGIHGHNGVDLANSRNTPILAAASGQVIIAKQSGWNGGYGSYIVISHSNGMQTLYAHLNSLNASVGQHVNQGDVIGAMGNTGDSSGVHLHFEVRGGTNPF